MHKNKKVSFKNFNTADGGLFRSRRELLSQKLQKITRGKPFSALLYSGSEVLRNGDVYYPFRCCSDFYYLTGFREPEAWALITFDENNGYEDLILSERKDKTKEIWNGKIIGQKKAESEYLFDKAFENTKSDIIIQEKIKGSEIIFFKFGSNLMLTKVNLWLSNLQKEKRNGINPANLYSDLKVPIENQRLIKEKYETDIMRKASGISAQGHRNAMMFARPGVKEFDIETELLRTFRNLGAEDVAYPSIVASGPNSCTLHHKAGQRALKEGELLLIDAGCELQGYASDITRTFPISKKFSSPQKLIYSMVLLAQSAAVEQIKPGNNFSAPHFAAVESLTNSLLDAGFLKSGCLDEAIETGEYKRFYMHKTGHWLGLDVHDVGSYDRKFEKNMVLTVEPGLYIQPTKDIPREFWNIGIRIEDDALVTKNGCDLISRDIPVKINEIEEITNS